MRGNVSLPKAIQDRKHWIIALFLFLTAATVAVAQLPTASVLGIVKDSSGAVVPDATLTARSSETGQTRTATAAADGSYRLSGLPVGAYEIRAEHAGFQPEVQSGLKLTVSQEAVVNFNLQVGAVEQAVQVTAEAPLVNTTSGSLGGLVSEERVADLPLNGRNYIDLTLLQPGISRDRNINAQGGLQTGVWYSSNGAPVRSNNYLLDGALLQSLFGASSSSASNTSLGVEGIREWRVITNSFSAEYGLAMGSQVMIVSKSGSNMFHGSLFEYLRNSALDARNFFDRQVPGVSMRRLPAFTRNNYGGSAGGPIRKDKPFFFADYEGLRERLGRTIISPTIPVSARVDGGALGVPQIAPFMKPLVALFPEPNLPNNQFTFPFSQPTRADHAQTRADHSFSDKDTAFGRYTIDDAELTQPITFPQFHTTSASRYQFGTLSENHVFSASLLNTFRFSFSRTNIHSATPSGIIGPQVSFFPGLEIGNISIAGLAPFGGSAVHPSAGKQNIFSYSDDLFYTRGRHSLKFGTLINHYQQFMVINSFLRGQVSFANLQSFLQGRPTVYFGITPAQRQTARTYHYNTLGFYLQDDLRVNSNFTLNLGLRYEIATTFNETKGHGSALRDIQHDAAPTLGDTFQNPSLRNFSPRVGFAWDVLGNGKTAVRGGFGLLYDIANLGSGLVSASTATPPFSNRSTVGGPPAATLFAIPFFFPPGSEGKSPRLVDYLMQQPHMLQYNLTVERQLPYQMAITVAYAGSRGINLMKVTEGNPTVPQVLPDGRQFWLGTESRTNPNWGAIDLRTAGGNSWYHSLQVGINKRVSRGLQFQSSYTWSKLIDETQGQLGVNAEDNSNYTFPTDPTHRNVDRGAASFDIAHNIRFNAIYRLPELSSGGAVGRALLNGWWTSGILSLQTGLPFSTVMGSNRSRSGVGAGQGDRPNLLPGRKNDNIILGGPDQYYDTSAFAVQDAGFLGTAGRNILRGPGFATLDFSLVKDIRLRPLGESGKLEFRAEFFNLLNRANFGTPGVGQGGGNAAGVVFAGLANGERPLPTAGRLIDTSSSSRQIQFALKILF